MILLNHPLDGSALAETVPNRKTPTMGDKRLTFFLLVDREPSLTLRQVKSLRADLFLNFGCLLRSMS